MNQNEKKEVMGKFAKKLENAIKREVAVTKEIENDKALIKYLEAQKAAGAALDTTAYESYDAWIDTIKKQIKKSESTLTNIEFKKVELEARMHHLPSELSGGQLQRVYIAMCLAQDTEIIILDEPTAFLDIKYQKSIMKLVKRLNQELHLTIIMVLHDINQAITYSDNIVALLDGEIIKNDKAHSLLDEELLNKIYDTAIKIEDGKVISW